MAMTGDEIQTRCNELSAAMVAKGLVQPTAMLWIESHMDPKVSLHWEDMKKPKGVYRTVGHYFRNGDITRMLFAEADAFVAALPDAEEIKLQDFMSALGNVIDMGRANGIDVAFVNPLVETMKRLSENALTHQRA